MPVWTTSNAVFNTSVADTARSKTFAVPATVNGLRPTTNFDFYLDGILFNWACKPWGGNLGDQLQSDIYGKLNFIFLYDFQYEGNYAFDSIPNTTTPASAYNQPGPDVYNYFTTTRFIELKGPGGAYASAYYPLRLLIIPDHINTIQSHSH